MLTCTHTRARATSPAAEIIGPPEGLCVECTDKRALYNDVFSAMAGNVYSLHRLAEAGLVPGLRPTLADLNRAGNVLHARLSPELQEAMAAEASEALDTIAHSQECSQPLHPLAARRYGCRPGCSG